MRSGVQSVRESSLTGLSSSKFGSDEYGGDAVRSAS
jgi:hypothetical protein